MKFSEFMKLLITTSNLKANNATSKANRVKNLSGELAIDHRLIT
jgi:hypothetical protein